MMTSGRIKPADRPAVLVERCRGELGGADRHTDGGAHDVKRGEHRPPG